MQIITSIFEIYSFILLGRILLSWFQVDPSNPIVQAVYALTEPLLAPIRQILPPTGALDFSPLVAFFLIRVVEMILLSVVR